jgi:hypothetical protein
MAQVTSLTRLSSALALSVVVLYGPATAAELPKEGTFTATYTGFGTYKGTAVGKERIISTWDENALSVGSGFLDRATWHCFGLNDTTALATTQRAGPAPGVTVGHGYCVVTDPDGDQIAVDLVIDKHAMDAKSWNGTGTFTTGTGKYTGISGSYTYVVHVGEFRPTTEGTYFNYGSGSGQLQAATADVKNWQRGEC